MQKIDRTNVVFKDYSSNQILLLPPSLEEMIDPNHPVRVVNQVVDSPDIDPLLKKYKGGGTSSYHPRLMLKILVYGYLTNQYSSLKIEQAVTQNIHFMWLSGMSYPDHNTINRFRSDRLKGVLKEVFSQVVLLLVDNGVITLKEVYLDGTKLEAIANRYTFVWGRSIINNKVT
jgi:transposase